MGAQPVKQHPHKNHLWSSKSVMKHPAFVEPGSGICKIHVSYNKFQTWHVIDWQHSSHHQPIRTHLTWVLTWILLSNLVPRPSSQCWSSLPKLHDWLLHVGIIFPDLLRVCQSIICLSLVTTIGGSRSSAKIRHGQIWNHWREDSRNPEFGRCLYFNQCSSRDVMSK